MRTPGSGPGDTWFREQVQASIDDPRPSIAGEVVEAKFAAAVTPCVSGWGPHEGRLRPKAEADRESILITSPRTTPAQPLSWTRNSGPRPSRSASA
ncbi:hypothetical protein [Propionivibrio sp.]|uniref:antitoxin PaaA2 family protein n=1 Tax=Propionivibrio sp. TaxID=2212460 RepID=UPI0034326F02